MNQLPPERMVRDNREMNMSASLLLFIACLLALKLVQSRKNAAVICAICKKCFESKPCVQTRPAHSFLADIKQCFGSNLVMDGDSRICSTCRAAISKHRETGGTFEHVSTHIYLKNHLVKQTFRYYCKVSLGKKIYIFFIDSWWEVTSSQEDDRRYGLHLQDQHPNKLSLLSLRKPIITPQRHLNSLSGASKTHVLER